MHPYLKDVGMRYTIPQRKYRAICIHDQLPSNLDALELNTCMCNTTCTPCELHLSCLEFPMKSAVWIYESFDSNFVIKCKIYYYSNERYGLSHD